MKGFSSQDKVKCAETVMVITAFIKILLFFLELVPTRSKDISALSSDPTNKFT